MEPLNKIQNKMMCVQLKIFSRIYEKKSRKILLLLDIK